MEPGEIAPAIRRVFDTVRTNSQLQPHIHNRWLTASFYTKLINSLSTTDFIFSEKHFNKFMVHKDYGFISCESFDGTNCTGIFRKTFDHKQFYFITTPGQQVDEPQTNARWALEIIGECTRLESQLLVRVPAPPSEEATQPNVPAPLPPPPPPLPATQPNPLQVNVESKFTTPAKRKSHESSADTSMPKTKKFSKELTALKLHASSTLLSLASSKRSSSAVKILNYSHAPTDGYEDPSWW